MSSRDRDWMKDEQDDPGSQELEDKLPQMVAEIDQAIAHLPLWARGIRASYEALVEAGFTTHQALYYMALQARSDKVPEDDE